MSHLKKNLSTDLGLLALTVIWGVNFSVLKVVLGELDPLALNALRFPLAAAALWLLVRALPGPRWPDRQDVPRLIALGFLGNVVYQLCFIVGIDWTLAGNASLLLATTPVWTLLLSRAAGHERPSTIVVTGVVGTLVGLVLVVVGRGEQVDIGAAGIRGDGLIILASMLWSVYTVGGRKPIAKYGSLRVTAWTLWVGTPILVLAGLPSLADTDLTAVSGSAWAGVVYSGLFAIGIAYLLWYRGVQRLGNNRTAVYSNLVPVAALITAWLWLGEVPTWLQLLGAGIILGGLTAARVGGQSPGASSLRWRISGNS